MNVADALKSLIISGIRFATETKFMDVAEGESYNEMVRDTDPIQITALVIDLWSRTDTVCIKVAIDNKDWGKMRGALPAIVSARIPEHSNFDDNDASRFWVLARALYDVITQ